MILRLLLLVLPLTLAAAPSGTQAELARLKQDIALLQGKAAGKTGTIRVPGEAPAVRTARHARAKAEAEEKWREEWNRKNPFKPSQSMPKISNSALTAALRESDEQALADQQSQIPALLARVAALEKKLAGK